MIVSRTAPAPLAGGPTHSQIKVRQTGETVPCGLDDPNWAEEKMAEFDLYEEDRDYGED